MTAPEYARDPGEPASVEFDFIELTHALKMLSDDVPLVLENDDDPEPAVLLLNDLRTARMQLQEIENYAQIEAIKRLKYGRNEVAGFIAEVRGGKDRKEWRTDELAWECVREFTVNKTSGEIDEADAALVGLVRDRLVNCARMEWRTTQLRPLGINPDDWSTSTPGRRTLSLIPAADEKPADA